MSKRVQLDREAAAAMSDPEAPGTPGTGLPTPRMSFGSPSVRATRIDEVNNLKELNKRLEYYILCQRARENTAANLRAELAAVREKAKTDFLELRQLYEKRMNQDNSARDREREELAATQAEVSRLQRELAQAKARLEVAEQEKLEIAEAAQQNLANYNEAKTKTIDLEAEVERLTNALQMAEEEALAKTGEAESARRDAAAKLKALQAKVSELDKLCAMKDSKLKLATSDIEALQKQYSELAQTAKDMEGVLMARFNSHLDREVKRLQQDYDNKLRDTLNDVKTDYDQSIGDLVSQVDALRAEKDDLKRQLGQVSSENRDLRLQNRDLQAQVEAAKAREAAVREELDRISAEHKQELQHLQTKIEQVDARARDQSQVMSMLIDARVNLEEEIEEYRKMIEAEGRRVGKNFFASSSGGNVPDFSRLNSMTALRRGSASDSTYAVLITDIDVDGSYIKIKNGTAAPVDLEGWRIRSQKSRKSFAFPQIILNPREVLTIHIGTDAKSRVQGPNELAWQVERAFHVSGDTAVLTDPTGAHISKVEVVAE